MYNPKYFFEWGVGEAVQIPVSMGWPNECFFLFPLQGPRPRPSAELAQAEELLEQQLELYQALLEGQEGAWEAQDLVLKIQKLKEQMRRHQESLRGDA